MSSIEQLHRKRTDGVVRRFAHVAEKAETKDALFALTEIYQAAIEDADDTGLSPEVPAAFRETVAAISDDRLGFLYAAAADATERFAAPYRWAQNVAKIEFENRMAARRKARGPEDRGAISIPHPAVEIENKVDVAYTFDADSIREALRGLPDDEIKKLLVIDDARTAYVLPINDGHVTALRFAIEELRSERESTGEMRREVAAHLETLLETREIPERVAVKHTGSLVAWLKKNVGSARATLVSKAVTIDTSASKTIIRPKAQIKRADPIVALGEPETAAAVEAL